MGRARSKTEVDGKRVRGVTRVVRAGQGARLRGRCEGDSKPAHAKPGLPRPTISTSWGDSSTAKLAKCYDIVPVSAGSVAPSLESSAGLFRHNTCDSTTAEVHLAVKTKRWYYYERSKKAYRGETGVQASEIRPQG